MKELIKELVLGMWIITSYMAVLVMIALSIVGTFGKIMMGIVATILAVATLNYLEELEQ